MAVVGYAVLHAYATSPLPPLKPGRMSPDITGMMGRGVALWLQYVLPFICLLGAALSAWRRRQAGQLHAEAAQRADGLARMDWRDFEVLVGEYFRREGFAATPNSRPGPDGGVDVIMRKGSDRYLVQCKHWRAQRVGVQVVRELYGVMAAQRVAGGFVVTSGRFTEDAREFASGREIGLIDGRTLQRKIRSQTQPVGAPETAPRIEPVFAPVPTPERPPATGTVFTPAAPPACPLCGAAMVMRQARTGTHAGRHFWGCSRYGETRCRGTRPVG